MKWLGIAGNYLLMMCYTVIAGWMLLYFFKYVKGDILQFKTTAELGAHFGETAANTPMQLLGTYATIILCFLVCSLGLQKGVERIKIINSFFIGIGFFF